MDNKRIAKNTMFLYVRMLIIMAVSLYTSRLVLQLLGVTDFGIYNVVGGFVAMLAFLNSSLGGATSRFIIFELGKGRSEALNKVFNTSLLMHIIIALIIVVFLETAGLWFFYNKIVIPPERMEAAFWVYQISVFTILFSFTQVPYMAMIIAHENMKIFALVGIFDGCLRLGVAFLLYFAPMDKLVYYAILIFFTQIIIMLYYRLYCNYKYNECKMAFCSDKALYKNMIGYSCADLVGNVSVIAQGQGLNVLLNLYFGPLANAAYAITQQVQNAITQFSGNFMTAVKPQIIKSYAINRLDEMMKLVERSSVFSFTLLWMIVCPLSMEAPYVLTLWLGEYPEYTVVFIRMMSVLCLIQTLKQPRTTIYHAMAKLKLVNIVVGGILCLALPLAYLFLRLGYKPESVFAAAIISMFISEIASVAILRHYLNFSVTNYIFNVYFRCIALVGISLLLPIYLFDKIELTGFAKLVFTTALTSVSILATFFVVGIESDIRRRILKYIYNRIKGL